MSRASERNISSIRQIANVRSHPVSAQDGYTNPLAHLLLYGQLADGNDVEKVSTVAFTFGDDEQTNLKRVMVDRATVLVDRNHHGAVIHQPPEFVTSGGTENTVVGLDTTANSRLWSMALGWDVEIVDIHETPRERQQFLRNVLNLQVVQTTPHVNSYSGSPTGKNFDGDIALVETVADEYGTQPQLRQDKLSSTTKPGSSRRRRFIGQPEIESRRQSRRSTTTGM